MPNHDPYQPKPEHKFTFGLWTVGNRGRDPFGDFVRPVISPVEIVAMLGEVGAWGVNLHDNDLVPIDATPAERDAIVRDFQKACCENGVVVPMATVSLFFHPIFRVGAFTANDPEVRAYAIQKTMRAMDLGAELGAKILEAKPNEPRGDIYMATTGHYLGFIPTLAHPEMVGVNPEVAHEQMAGLNFLHGVAQAWEAGKLFHIDLNDQLPGRYDQDLRFGSVNLKGAFWLVKFLEDVGYQGSRHFDAHAYRTEDYEGVKDFARGCMRSYLILKEKADRWNADEEIRDILEEVGRRVDGLPCTSCYSSKGAEALLGHAFDKDTILKKRLPYERLDQLTVDVLAGVR
jgi:xylose isomerase